MNPCQEVECECAHVNTNTLAAEMRGQIQHSFTASKRTKQCNIFLFGCVGPDFCGPPGAVGHHWQSQISVFQIHTLHATVSTFSHHKHVIFMQWLHVHVNAGTPLRFSGLVLGTALLLIFLNIDIAFVMSITAATAGVSAWGELSRRC